MEQQLSEKTIALRNVVQRRMDERKAAGSAAALQAISDLMKQHEDTKDYLVPARTKMNTARRIIDGKPGRPVLQIFKNSGTEPFHIHDNAMGQLAAKAEIPIRYLRKLADGDDWEQDLFTNIVNEHLSNGEDKNYLLRTVNQEVRGMLSDSYKRMDSAPVFAQFAQSARQAGAILWGGTTGDVRAYMEVVNPVMRTIETPRNGTVFVAFGASLSSSDFGQGSLELRQFYVQGICANGAIGKSMVRQVHLGVRMSGGMFSDEARRASSHAASLAIRDFAKHCLSEDTIRQQIHQINQASEKVIADPERAIKELPKIGLQEDEVKLIHELLMESNPDNGIQGEVTKWKLQQSVTAAARVLAPVRRRQVELIAGQMI